MLKYTSIYRTLTLNGHTWKVSETVSRQDDVLDASSLVVFVDLQTLPTRRTTSLLKSATQKRDLMHQTRSTTTPGELLFVHANYYLMCVCRVWVREGEVTMVKRVKEAMKDLLYVPSSSSQ